MHHHYLMPDAVLDVNTQFDHQTRNSYSLMPVIVRIIYAAIYRWDNANHVALYRMTSGPFIGMIRTGLHAAHPLNILFKSTVLKHLGLRAVVEDKHNPSNSLPHIPQWLRMIHWI